MFDDVVKTEYGYYQLKNIPTDEERVAYYEKNYFKNNDNSTYKNEYSEEELSFLLLKAKQIFTLLTQHGIDSQKNSNSFLDIGCGEGFLLKYFKQQNFQVFGLDISTNGISNHNPDLLPNLTICDAYEGVKKFASDGKRFTVINMSNVLEHVSNPKDLLVAAHSALEDNGIIIVRVPNDFSKVQKYFFDNGIVGEPSWVCYPDHISYFSKDSLVALCQSVGLNNVDLLADSLIEIYALNENTNYFKERTLGKSCYNANMKFENLITDISTEETLNLYRQFMKLGIGRNILGLFRKV